MEKSNAVAALAALAQNNRLLVALTGIDPAAALDRRDRLNPSRPQIAGIVP
jgi:hypothetical protein